MRMRVSGLPGWPGVLAVGLTLLIAGCDREPDPEPPQVTQPAPPAPPAAADSELDQHLRDRLARDSRSRLSEAEAAATALCESLRVLRSTPSESNLRTARSRWRDAHEQYRAAATLLALQGRTEDPALDAWPALGGYIDRAPGYPHSGIVFDTTVEISAETLQAQHQLTDASEVSIGFHALEYLLWGDPEDAPRGEELFRPAAGATTPDAEARERRRDYLATACKLLAGQLGSLARASGEPAPGTGAASMVSAAARILGKDLQARHVAPLIRSPAPDLECAFAGAPLCGVLPAVRVSIAYLNDARLQTAIEELDAGMASNLLSQLAALGESLDGMEGLAATELPTAGESLQRLSQALGATAQELAVTAAALRNR